jgi:hypothetical protein
VYWQLAVVEQEQVLLRECSLQVDRQYLVLPVLLKLLLEVAVLAETSPPLQAQAEQDPLDQIHHQRAGKQLLPVAVELLLSMAPTAVGVVVLVDTLPLAVVVEQVLSDHQRLVQVAVAVVVVPQAVVVVVLGCLD